MYVTARTEVLLALNTGRRSLQPRIESVAVLERFRLIRSFCASDIAAMALAALLAGCEGKSNRADVPASSTPSGGVSAAGAFYCEKSPAYSNTLRLCYLKGDSCEAKGGCFIRDRAFCYIRSAMDLSGPRTRWSEKDTIHVCFPTTDECREDVSKSGTGSLGPPPLQTKCHETRPDEVR